MESLCNNGSAFKSYCGHIFGENEHTLRQFVETSRPVCFCSLVFGFVFQQFTRTVVFYTKSNRARPRFVKPTTSLQFEVPF